MSRDDSLLYTGSSSASFGSSKSKQLEEEREAKTEAKRELRHKLKPAAEVVNETIAGEKRLLTEKLMRLPIDMKTTDKEVKSTLLALQMNLAFIDRFHNKVNNILREK